MNKREHLISLLATIVIESNIQCYANLCYDEEINPTADDFSNYGTDEETITIVLKELHQEVTKQVQFLQPLMANTFLEVVKRRLEIEYQKDL